VEVFATVSNPQPSPPCSLITVCASLSSRSPANLECRRWSTYASYCTPHGVSHQIAGPKTASYRPGANDSTALPLNRPRVLLGQEVALAKIGSHASGPFCSTL